MKECREFKKKSTAFLAGELREGERPRLESHLDFCSSCRREFSELKAVIIGGDLLGEDIQREMSALDWELLPEKITRAVFAKEKRPAQGLGFQRLLAFLSQPQWKPVTAGILAGLVLGSVLTWMVIRSWQPQPRQEKMFSASGDALERIELELARRETLDYLGQSQLLILDFIQTPREEGALLRQAGETGQRARDLLVKKKYINAQLEKFPMAKAKAICDQIELLFYELTQVSGQLSEEEVQRLQVIVEENQLLLKIKLLKKDLKKGEV